MSRSCICCKVSTLTEAGVCISGVSAKPAMAARATGALALTITSGRAWSAAAVGVVGADADGKGLQHRQRDGGDGEIWCRHGVLFSCRCCRHAAFLYLFGRSQRRSISKEGDHFALSFAGIIQIRYEGYLSPGTNSRTPSEARV